MATTDTDTDTEKDTERDPGDYAHRLGARLRAARLQQGLSLQQAAVASNGLVTASLLGAYERGERRVSVHRLQQLAEVYRVGVDQLLPSSTATVAAGNSEKLRLDLTALRASRERRGKTVLRFGETILRRRHDLNGHVVTLRMTDVEALAAAEGISVDELVAYLSRRGLSSDGASRPART